MEPIKESIPSDHFHSFHVHRAVHKYLYTPWHYHPEMEIIYVHQGTGTRYVGNNVSPFEPGEIVLMGPNLPHVWQNDRIYYHEDSKLTAEVWVIHFLADFWGEQFINLAELKPVKDLFHKASRGILFNFSDKTKNKFITNFEKLLAAQSFERLKIILELFGLMAECQDLSFLNTTPVLQTNISDSERLQRVYSYVLDNYLKEIHLEEVAEIANLSVTGFCRYFKKINSKTFIEYVNEVRVEHACRLLREEDTSVTASCYESGFNNFSNFSRHFKKITGLSPIQYRKKITNTHGR